jgi:predicted metal-dependent phosphoesterase TrpH
MHSTRSDGSLEPAALVAEVARAGLSAFALTDHDTFEGLDEAREAARAHGLEMLPGVEVTARFSTSWATGGAGAPAGLAGSGPEPVRRAMHVLGYAFDPREPRLSALLAEVRAGRTERNARILDRLAALGCALTLDDVRGECGPRGGTLGRPHIAAALVRRGHVPDTRTAFARYLKDGGPAYVGAEVVDPEEVVAAVRGAGGVAVLAHPRQLRLEEPAAWPALFARLAAVGFAGVEVQHPSHDAAERETFLGLADAHGLVPSGGSDFHGLAKPTVALGTGDGTIEVGYETWERLRARGAA